VSDSSLDPVQSQRAGNPGKTGRKGEIEARRRLVEQFRLAGLTERGIAAELTKRNVARGGPPVARASVQADLAALQKIWDRDHGEWVKTYKAQLVARLQQDLLTFTTQLQSALKPEVEGKPDSPPRDPVAAARWADRVLRVQVMILEVLGLAPTQRISAQIETAVREEKVIEFRYVSDWTSRGAGPIVDAQATVRDAPALPGPPAVTPPAAPSAPKVEAPPPPDPDEGWRPRM